MVNVKPSLHRSIKGPGGKASEFRDCRDMKVVRLSAIYTVCLYPPPRPQEIFMVLISVRGSVEPRVIVRSEGLCR